MRHTYEFAFIYQRGQIKIHTSELHTAIAAVVDIDGNVIKNEIGDEIEEALLVFEENKRSFLCDFEHDQGEMMVHFSDMGFRNGHFMLSIMHHYDARSATIFGDRAALSDFAYQLYTAMPSGWVMEFWGKLVSDLQEAITADQIENFRILEAGERDGRIYIRPSHETERITEVLQRYAAESAGICAVCGFPVEVDDGIPYCLDHRI